MLKDVVVIGAGPAGTTIGEKLSMAGFEVLIVEKTDFPGQKKPCGGAISKGFFKELGLAEDKIIEKETNKLIVHQSGQSTELSYQSGFVTFERERFDSSLAQKAVEKGVNLWTSTLVKDIKITNKGAMIQYKKLLKNETGKIKARLVVFADGAETLAQKTLKIGFQKRPECTLMAAACDLEWKNNSWDSLDFFVSEDISPFGYGWIFPRRNSINVGVTVLLSKLKQSIKQHLDQLLKLERIKSHKKTKFGFRLIPQSIAENIFSDSTLVIGDAAGTTDPITQSGIQNAIINARIAANAAKRALEKGILTADLLKDYETEWKQTECYKNLVKKYELYKAALKIGINPAIALQMVASDTGKASA